jgi:hypothetical protein
MVALALRHAVNPYAIIGPMILICCGSGLITPNAIAATLGVDVAIVGAASGLVSFIQMSGAAGATAALSLGATGSPVVLAAVIASAGLFAVGSFGALSGSSRFSAKAGARLCARLQPRLSRPRLVLRNKSLASRAADR